MTLDIPKVLAAWMSEASQFIALLVVVAVCVSMSLLLMCSG